MSIDILKCPKCGNTDIRRFESVSYTQTVKINEAEVTEIQHPNEWCHDVDRIWCENCQYEFSGFDTLEEMNERLKDVLTIDEIEAVELESTTGLYFEVVEGIKEAEELAAKERGIIYTQVDSEVSDDRVYSKGVHFVNRTGMYAVVMQG